MKIRHKVNHGWQRPVEPISDRYWAEVARSTRRAERAYSRAIDLLEKAQARAARARCEVHGVDDLTREIRVADELVELRRAELRAIEAMMLAAPASAQHRGVRSFRPVPPTPTKGGI